MGEFGACRSGPRQEIGFGFGRPGGRVRRSCARFDALVRGSGVDVSPLLRAAPRRPARVSGVPVVVTRVPVVVSRVPVAVPRVPVVVPRVPVVVPGVPMVSLEVVLMISLMILLMVPLMISIVS